MTSRAEVALIGTHIFPAKGYGGVAESLYNLATAWGLQGHSIQICVSDGSKGTRLSVVDVKLPGRAHLSLYRAIFFKRWGFGLGALPRILAACVKARSVYICGIATWPTTLAALYCALLRRPFVVSPRGGLMAGHIAEIKATKPHKWLFYKILTLPTLRAAKFIHVTSSIERDGVLALLPRVQCEIVVNGVDLRLWSAIPSRRGRSTIFTFVGRIERDKGINRFARIWLSVRHLGDRLLIAGNGDGAYEEELRALTRTSGGDIEMLGYLDRDGIHAALGRSDFLVLPSGIEGDNARENLGNAVVEAMATGRPVLVSKGLAWDFIEQSGLGFVFDGEDTAIAAAIGRASALSRDVHDAMCRRARDYAENNLALDKAAGKLWSLLP